MLPTDLIVTILKRPLPHHSRNGFIAVYHLIAESIHACVYNLVSELIYLIRNNSLIDVSIKQRSELAPIRLYTLNVVPILYH
jgi:hypothetical protein